MERQDTSLPQEESRPVPYTQLEFVKQLLEQRIAATEKALVIARTELERRLEGLNELRKEVVNDRTEFVKNDVYVPAHEELRRQRVTDAERITVITGDVKNNTTEIAAIKNSLMWLTRLLVSGLLLALITYAFQKLTNR